MKKLPIYILFLLLAGNCFAQHYYKDLLVAAASSKKHQVQRINKVKSIKYLSFDADNNPIEGFSSDQQINRDFSEVVITTTSSLTGTNRNISHFNGKDLLIKTVDTSEGSSTTVNYEYDNNYKISKISNITLSTGGFIMKEVHLWSYRDDGKPLRMLKIKNDKDTTQVDFVIDEQGNVGEEKSILRGRNLPTIYYYYEDRNLTDIVKYNIAAKRLLPDYVFEYEEKDRLASMLVVPEEGSDYQKWYYSYDEDGLKILDACYSKTKQLIGRIEYQYEYYK